MNTNDLMAPSASSDPRMNVEDPKDLKKIYKKIPRMDLSLKKFSDFFNSWDGSICDKTKGTLVQFLDFLVNHHIFYALIIGVDYDDPKNEIDIIIGKSFKSSEIEINKICEMFNRMGYEIYWSESGVLGYFSDREYHISKNMMVTDDTGVEHERSIKICRSHPRNTPSFKIQVSLTFPDGHVCVI